MPPASRLVRQAVGLLVDKQSPRYPPQPVFLRMEYRPAEYAQADWAKMPPPGRTLGAGSPDVSVLAPGGVAGSTLKVRVQYQVPSIAGAFLPVGNLTASGEATTRQEGW